MIDLRKLLAERAAQGIGTGGGLLGSQANQGLLGGMANINPNVLIGASIAGAGLRGINPFSAVLPAVTQAAQLQKYLTPKSSFRQLTDTEKKERGLPEDKQFQIGADGKVLQIGGTGTTVNVGASNKFRIKATDEEKENIDKLNRLVVQLKKLVNLDTEIYDELHNLIKKYAKD